MSFLLMKGKRQQAPQQQPQRQLQPGGRPGPSILTHHSVLQRGTSGVSSLQAKYAPKHAAVPTVTPLRQQQVPASALRVAQTQQPRRTTVSHMQQQQLQTRQQEHSCQAEKQTKAEGEVISMEEGESHCFEGFHSFSMFMEGPNIRCESQNVAENSNISVVFSMFKESPNIICPW